MLKSMFKIILLAASCTILSPAMDNPSKVSPIRKEIDSPEAQQNNAKKAKSDSDLQKELCIEKINQEIYNLDPNAIGTYLTLESCKSLTRDEKFKLCECASHYANQINQFAQAGSQLTVKSTNADLKQRLSHKYEIASINRITTLLNVYLHLKNLRFPQALFSPKAYPQGLMKGPRISLDKALISLIMAEQEQISSCCFHLTLYNLATALVDKKTEGVDIELVTDQSQGNNPSLQALKLLVANGVSVSSPRNKPFEINHHKFFIFKNNVLNKPLVWMGSYNPTGNSNENSWDDAMILDDADVIQDYLQRFNEVKTASKLITIQELNAIKSIPTEYSLRNNNVPKELWK